MQELIELGVDTSKASMCWVETPYNGNFVIPYNEDCRNAIAIAYGTKTPESVPTFTLQDILEMLPHEIPSKIPDFETYSLHIIKWDDCYTLEYQEYVYEEEYTEMFFYM